MKVYPKVTEKYFGMPIGDGQSADEPYDKASKGNKSDGGTFKTGRGSQGGGSKPTPQTAHMKQGSAGGKGSYPRQTQKIRGR